MVSFRRPRYFMLCGFTSTLARNANDHIWGGHNQLTDGSVQGTSFPVETKLSSGQMVANVTRAGSGPPGSEFMTFRTRKNNNTNTGYSVGPVLATTGWKREIDYVVANAGADEFDGEDYAATPDELLGDREHVGTSVGVSPTCTIHGEYV